MSWNPLRPTGRLGGATGGDAVSWRHDGMRFEWRPDGGGVLTVEGVPGRPLPFRMSCPSAREGQEWTPVLARQLRAGRLPVEGVFRVAAPAPAPASSAGGVLVGMYKGESTKPGEHWITMRGRHVLIDGDGNILKGGRGLGIKKLHPRVAESHRKEADLRGWVEKHGSVQSPDGGMVRYGEGRRHPKAQGWIEDPTHDIHQYIDEMHAHNLKQLGTMEERTRARKEEEDYESQGVDPEPGANLKRYHGKKVWLYHGTTDAFLDDIKKNGLRYRGKRSNVGATAHGPSRHKAVFLTSNSGSGPGGAMQYARAAANKHGGKPTVIRVLVDGSDLRYDPDDTDISSGRSQYLMDAVSPDDIREIDGEKVGGLSKGTKPGEQWVTIRGSHILLRDGKPVGYADAEEVNAMLEKFGASESMKKGPRGKIDGWISVKRGDAHKHPVPVQHVREAGGKITVKIHGSHPAAKRPGRKTFTIDAAKHKEIAQRVAARGKQAEAAAEQKEPAQEPASEPTAAKPSVPSVRERRWRPIAQSFMSKVKANNSASIVGQEAKTPAELAELAQVYRDGRMETLRYFWMKGDTIVGHTGVSSRMVSYSSAYPFDIPAAKFTSWLAEQKERHGADGYYMLHNHPSGVPTPSEADMSLTALVAASVPGFKGHVIINHEHYGHITAGRAKGGSIDLGKDVRTLPSVMAEPPSMATEEHEAIGKRVASPPDVVKVAKGLQAEKGWISLIGLDAQGKVQAITQINSQMYAHRARGDAALRSFARSTGSASVMAVAPAEEFKHKASRFDPDASQRIYRGLLTDQIEITGERYQSRFTTGMTSPNREYQDKQAARRARLVVNTAAPLKKGEDGKKPTGFLTNDDGHVFPVFGNKYQPKDLKRHLEIVQKIHDNTKDPEKKAKHAEYLAALSASSRPPVDLGKPKKSDGATFTKALSSSDAGRAAGIHNAIIDIREHGEPDQHLWRVDDSDAKAGAIMRHLLGPGGIDGPVGEWAAASRDNVRGLMVLRAAETDPELRKDIMAAMRPAGSSQAWVFPHWEGLSPKDVRSRAAALNALDVAHVTGGRVESGNVPRHQMAAQIKRAIALDIATSSTPPLQEISAGRMQKHPLAPATSDAQYWEDAITALAPLGYRLDHLAGSPRAVYSPDTSKEGVMKKGTRVTLRLVKGIPTTTGDIAPMTAGSVGGAHPSSRQRARAILERIHAGTRDPARKAEHAERLDAYGPALGMPPGRQRKQHPFVGTINFQGIPIAVENEQGSYREGVDGSGKPWRAKMHAHYGEIHGLGTRGTDGDKLDVYVGPHADATHAYIIDQHDPDTGTFDEQKVMLGFRSAAHADEVYRKQYDRPGFHGGTHEMPMEQFKAMVRDAGRRGRPLTNGRPVVLVKGGDGQPTGFLTNDDGNVFPVFGGKYKPRDMARHLEIVQKIHDHTRDPEKKAKHAAYLAQHGHAVESAESHEAWARGLVGRYEAGGADYSNDGRTGKARLERLQAKATSSIKDSRRWIESWRGNTRATPEKVAKEIAEETENIQKQEAIIKAATERLGEMAKEKRAARKAGAASATAEQPTPTAEPVRPEPSQAEPGPAEPEPESEFGAYEVTEKDKIALQFSRKDFAALPEKTQADIRRYYNWSPTREAWVSKAGSTDHNANRIAKDAGFHAPAVREPLRQSAPYKPVAVPVAGLAEGAWHKASHDDIPLELARRAHAGMSWDPERRGDQERADHVGSMDAAANALKPLADTEDKQALLKSMLEQYRQGLVNHHTAMLAAKSRVVSPYIAGPSKFPVRRMEKANNSLDARIREMADYKSNQMERMRKALRDDGPVMAWHEGATEKLAKQLADAEAAQAQYKAINKIVGDKRRTAEQKKAALVEQHHMSEKRAGELLEPDFAGRLGVPGYLLSNNSANIRRLKQRIADITARTGGEMKKGSVRPMLKGERKKPDGFITVGGGKEEGGHIIPVWGFHPHPDKHGKLVVESHSGHEFEIDKDRHEAVKRTIERSGQEAAGQTRMFGRDRLPSRAELAEKEAKRKAEVEARAKSRERTPHETVARPAGGKQEPRHPAVEAAHAALAQHAEKLRNNVSYHEKQAEDAEKQAKKKKPGSRAQGTQEHQARTSRGFQRENERALQAVQDLMHKVGTAKDPDAAHGALTAALSGSGHDHPDDRRVVQRVADELGKAREEARGVAPSAKPASEATPRLARLQASLEKKQAKADKAFDTHFADVAAANGQPLNDKRNGSTTRARWERQSDTIRAAKEEIGKTERAIEREKNKAEGVKHANSKLPPHVLEMVQRGELAQWRKNPNTFFVPGVDKGRIVVDMETGEIGARYMHDIPKEQYPKFRDTVNVMLAKQRGAQAAPKVAAAAGATPTAPSPSTKPTIEPKPAPTKKWDPDAWYQSLTRDGISPATARAMVSLRKKQEGEG